MTNASVEQILIDEKAGKVIGVQLFQDNEGQEPHIIHAPIVCSDAGIVNTATKLLSSSTTPKIELYLSSENYELALDGKLHSGMTGLNLFVGLNITTDELGGILSCQYWIHPNNDLDWTADITVQEV